MDCAHRIPSLRTPAKHHQPKSYKSHYTRSGAWHCCEDRDREVIPGYNHISTDTAAPVTMIHIEAIPGHDIGIIITIPGVAHDAQVPHTGVIVIDPTVTHHIKLNADHLCTEAHPHTIPESEVAHIHVHPTNPQDEIHIGHIHTPVDHQANPHHKKNTRVKIEDPHMDYYSSDDQSNNSGEETDHLN